MKNTIITHIEQIKPLAVKYKYALLYGYRYIKLINGFDSSELDKLDFNSLYAARFFDENGEMHVVNEGQITAYKSDDDADDEENSSVRTVALVAKFADTAPKKELKIKEYYDYDDDGQLQISRTRLYSIA